MSIPHFKKMISSCRADVLSGLTVALALVPEAVAFSFVAGVAPLVGLYAAFFVGLITALLGRKGMISGATGAMAVVMVALVKTHGVEYLFAAVVLTGILQLLAGVFRLGRFIRLVPHPVMLGFVNGLAIVIFLAQIDSFKVMDASGQSTWMTGTPLAVMIGLIALTMAIIAFLPRFTKIIPSSLAAILVVSGIAIFGGLGTKSVGDVASIAGSLPIFHIPLVPFNLETLQIILPFSLVLAGVGLIESLLTLRLIDEMTESKGSTTRECFAQGLANLVTGFFGGMGGCAMIGQSMINISSGGRGRLSGITAALALLAFVLFGAALIEQIPIAALTGVMFMVVIGTFEWTSLKVIKRVPKADAFVMICVATFTVFTDLAVAVLVGIIISALHFAWKHAHLIEAQVASETDESKTYRINGSLFFASTSHFQDLFDISKSPKTVILDFENAKVYDHSGLQAIDSLAVRFNNQGKQLRVLNLSQECIELIEKAGDLVNISYENIQRT